LFFCFEQFEVYDGEININTVGDGNE